MEQCVHVDEKWFLLTQEKQKLYFVEGEILPERQIQSKRFIPKVMFLCAVARPRYDFHRKKMFSGKLGIWPFVKKEPAKRSSVNRAKGTLETKPISVDDQVYSDFIKKKYCLQFVKKCPMVISILNKLIP